MKISKKVFGTTSNDIPVEEITISNGSSYVSFLTLGGIITKIVVPDANNKYENVVLGFNDIESYETKSPFFGSLVGRTSGRISNGRFTINGKTYQLEQNDNTNNLHGGPKGLDKVVWSIADTKESKDEASCQLQYISPDGENKFPGNVDIKVTYTFTKNNIFKIKYAATTDQATILNLTNHSYFNLSGNLSSDILDHDLRIDADYFVATDKISAPKALIPVDNTPFDFRTKKKIGKDISKDDEQLILASGYDHPFKLNSPSLEATQINLTDPKSKRSLSVTTDNVACVVYTSNYLDESVKIYDSINVKKRGAICLETQYIPDDINCDFLETKSILKKDEEYNKTTIFAFGIEK